MLFGFNILLIIDAPLGFEDSFGVQHFRQSVLVEYRGSSLAIAVPCTFHIGVPVQEPKYGFLLGDIFGHLHFGAIGRSLGLDPIPCLELPCHIVSIGRALNIGSGHFQQAPVGGFPFGETNLQNPFPKVACMLSGATSPGSSKVLWKVERKNSLCTP